MTTRNLVASEGGGEERPRRPCEGCADRIDSSDCRDRDPSLVAPGPRPPAWFLALFYLAYVLAGGFGQGLAIIPGVAITFWPPAGIFVTTMLLSPRRAWPWWVLAGCLAELTCNALWFHNPVPFAVVYFAANALEALTAAWLIDRFAARPFRLELPREVTAFVVLGAGVAPMVGATVIAITDALRGKHPFTTAWPLVWLGDGTGLLVSTPLTLVAVQAWRERVKIPTLRILEAVALGLLLLAVGGLSFRGLLPTVYMTLPLLLWGAVRFQLRGAAVALALLALMTAVFTVQGQGEFAGDPARLHQKIVMLQSFLGISAASALVVAALSLQHQQALLRVRAANAELEARVAERTAELRDSEARLRLFIENAPAAIAMFDRDMRYAAASRRWRTDYSLGNGDLVGRSHYELFPDTPEAWREAHRRGLAGESLRSEGDPIVGADGATRWVRWEVLPWRTGADEIGGILVSTEDITARMEVEGRLRASEGRLRLALEASDTGMWEWDLRTDAVDWSSACYTIHGLAQGSFDGTGAGFFWLVHPEDRARVEATVRGAIACGARYECEFRVCRPNGEVRWVANVGRASHDETGQPIRMTGTIADITERKRAEVALREADRRKDEFLAMLAHELRNPLAPIRNAVQILRLSGSREPVLDTASDMIERQVGHLVRMVDDLLDVSRVSRGKIQLQKAPLDLTVVARQAAEASQTLVDSRRHRLALSLPPGPVRVEGDFTRLTQVVSNLLNNAAKYTDEGGRIWLTVELAGSEAVVRVRDTGRGIDPAALGSLFDLFYQVDRNLDRSDGGLGIGLSLVRSLVEMHGGRVEARSPGRGLGSEFVVRLPLVEAPEGAPVGSPAREAAAAPRGSRILVVDDNRDSAESMAMLLRLEGHEVVTAHDGRRAVEVALARRPEVVLLDIGLPVLDGYQACRAMREGGLTQALIVAMTGYGQEEDRRLAQEAGFDVHQVKPVDLQALWGLLKERGAGR